MIKGAIFDVDGTLLDSMYIWDNVCTDYLKARGIVPRAGLWETFKTMSLYDAALYYKREYAIEDTPAKIMDDINAIVEHQYFCVAQLKSGVREFLESLYARGVKMSIATATDKYLVEAALCRLGINSFFSQIFTCTIVGSGKDNRAIFDAAAAHMGTLPEETLVFEDAFHAAKTAKAAGYGVVGIYDAHEANRAQMKELCDFYINSFDEAGAIINV